ncbi:hypothetical protein MTO96_018309 [Rhipicephalus appendiculatus]
MNVPHFLRRAKCLMAYADRAVQKWSSELSPRESWRARTSGDGRLRFTPRASVFYADVPRNDNTLARMTTNEVGPREALPRLVTSGGARYRVAHPGSRIATPIASRT